MNSNSNLAVSALPPGSQDRDRSALTSPSGRKRRPGLPLPRTAAVLLAPAALFLHSLPASSHNSPAYQERAAKCKTITTVR